MKQISSHTMTSLAVRSIYSTVYCIKLELQLLTMVHSTAVTENQLLETVCSEGANSAKLARLDQESEANSQLWLRCEIRKPIRCTSRMNVADVLALSPLLVRH